MPNNPSIPQDSPPRGNASFAAQIAAHPEAVSLPCPTTGLVYSRPRPKRSLVDRITAGLLREERHRQERERLIQLYGATPPNTREVC